VPINSLGELSIGSTDPAGTASHGGISLTGTNTIPSIAVNYAALAVNSPAALGTGPVTLDHAVLSLTGLRAASGGTTAFVNPITIKAVSRLTASSINSGVPGLSVGPLTLGASLELDVDYFTNFTIASLRPTADATLTVGGPNVISIGALLADNNPHALTFTQPNSSSTSINITGPVADTGPITITATYLEFNGSVAPSSNPITLAPGFNGSGLGGSASINRPIIVIADRINVFYATGALSAPSIDVRKGFLRFAGLQGSATTTAFTVAAAATIEFWNSFDFSSPANPTLNGSGLVIIRPGVTLTLPIDSAFTGTIQINGTLVLAPPLNPATFDGTPTFNVIGIPIPEPTALSTLLLASPLLLRRRRPPQV
jgi:hypothetical protein